MPRREVSSPLRPSGASCYGDRVTELKPLDAPEPLKLTLADFELLHRAGAFEGYRKVELIEGVLLTMSPQQRAHSFAANELAFRLRLALSAIGSSLLPLIEGTVAMPPRSAPEPDIALTDSPKGEGYIPLESLALAVEVANSSVRFDLGAKAELYAKHAVPEYWVVDLRKRQIHQLWAPSETGYRERRAVAIGEPIESVCVPGLAVQTEGLV